MDSIKKKMMAMKLEKENALEKYAICTWICYLFILELLTFIGSARYFLKPMRSFFAIFEDSIISEGSRVSHKYKFNILSSFNKTKSFNLTIKQELTLYV